jgi:hypothetical protein
MATMQYRVTVKGTLSDRLIASIVTGRLERTSVTTSFTCELPDQAALWGLLDQLNDLGLEIAALESAGDTRGPAAAPELRNRH